MTSLAVEAQHLRLEASRDLLDSRWVQVGRAGRSPGVDKHLTVIIKLPIAGSYVARHAMRASRLVKGRRRVIDLVIEVDTIRGWRVLRTFRDIDQCRAFLVALPSGDKIEFVTP
jgi:hypothetical protein